LHVENNTDYDFNVSQSRAGINHALDTIEAHNSKEFTQLPWTYEIPNEIASAIFSFDNDTLGSRGYSL
jgi:hypothetical protein